jgi:hypothetical protein
MTGSRITRLKTAALSLEPVTLGERLFGVFFIAASWWKIYGILFGGDWSIRSAARLWNSMGWTPDWYAFLLDVLFGLSWLPDLGLVVAAFQGVAGVLILAGRLTRVGGIVLFAIQLNIFLGTFHMQVFNEFVGISLWAALYFIIAPARGRAWVPQTWTFMTVLLVAFYALQIDGMFDRRMHLLYVVEEHRDHFASDVMSIAHPVKEFVLAITSGRLGSHIWIAPVFLQIGVLALFLTRFRLYAGVMALCIAFAREWMWINSVTSYGVFWVLVLLLWCAREHEMRKTADLPSLLQLLGQGFRRATRLKARATP